MALTFRIIGFVASLILTLATYFVVVYANYFNFALDVNISLIFIFAILQGIVQLIFFINVWREKGPLWNLWFFLSTVATVILIVAFTMWIMYNLDYNMMPRF